MSDHGGSKKYIWMVLVALSVMTVLELMLPMIQGMRNFVIFGLVALALTKAACVLVWYMHLGHETKALKASVIYPFFIPLFYAVVLIAEAMYRGGIAWPKV
jgi:caa(3)-type oxidase subunit IV